MALAFEQQPKESDKAFAAFALYLSMGAERSLEVVARKLNKSKTIIGRWSSRWQWMDRVAAHTAHLAAIEREATEALVRTKAVDWADREQALREEEWQTRAEALELAREAITRWKENPKRCGSLEGIARLLELASTLGRRATGLPLERTEVSGQDGGPIQVEFELALRKIYGQVLADGHPAGPAVVDVEAVPPPQLPEGR